jgi:hypothetical protein
MKRREKHAFEEGSAKAIWTRIIAPLIRYKPQDQDMKQWLEILFHTEDRTIQRFVVKKPFTMPGLYHTAPLTKVQGIGPRHVNKGDIIWARMDVRNPSEIQVEIERKTRGHLFSLDSSQWGWTLLHLERMERKSWLKGG